MSGANFLSTVLIGRYAGPEQLGAYSLGFTLIVILTGLQSALITIPYTIYGNRLHGQARREYAGSTLSLFIVFAGFAATGLGIGAIFYHASAPGQSLARVISVLTCTIPLLLLRDFVRRYALAHMRLLTALAVDAAATLLQISGLILLVTTGHITAVFGHTVLGVSALLASGAAIVILRQEFKFTFGAWKTALYQHWRLGRWIVASHTTATVQTYCVHWLLAGLAGTAATGVYAAALTLLLLANPLIIGIGNILEPRAANAFAEGGVAALRRVAWNATLLLTATLGAYCAVLTFAGGSIVAWIYHQPAYAGEGMTVALLALAALAGSIDLGPAHGLRVLERANFSFVASIASLVVTVSVGWVLVLKWEILGGAGAMLAGNVTGSVIRCAGFAYFTQRGNGNNGEHSGVIV